MVKACQRIRSRASSDTFADWRRSEADAARRENRVIQTRKRIAMALPTSGLLVLLGVTAVLVLTFVLRPAITTTKGGKILAFFVLFLLPVLCLGVGTTYHIDRSKQ